MHVLISVAPANSLKSSPSCSITNVKLWPPRLKKTTTVCFSNRHRSDSAARLGRALCLASPKSKSLRWGRDLSMEMEKRRKTIASSQLVDTGGGGNNKDDGSHMFDGGDGDKDDGDSGLSRRRHLVMESFEKATINSALRTLRLISSARLMRFVFLRALSSLRRLFPGLLSQRLSWDFRAKIMADPGLTRKIFWEAFFSAAWSLWVDLKNICRSAGEESIDYRSRFRRRPSLLLINAAANAACSAFVGMTCAPSPRFYERYT